MTEARPRSVAGGTERDNTEVGVGRGECVGKTAGTRWSQGICTDGSGTPMLWCRS